MEAEKVMPDTMIATVGQRGVITLPKSLRDANSLQPGDTLTVLDIGGVFILTPRRSQIDTLADQIAKSLTAQGETMASMLRTLCEARESYGKRAK